MIYLKKITIVFIFLVCINCDGNKQPPTTLPNIILLIGDDQGYPYFGFMGADYVQTPNMDKLAASGTLFTNGYVSDNHCRPSLQTLLTGILPIDYYRKAAALLDKMVLEKGISKDSVAGFRRDFDLRSYHMQNYNALPKLLQEKGYVSFQSFNGFPHILYQYNTWE